MSDTRFELHLGDCMDVLRTLAAASVDSIVTDPPYHLTNNSGGPSKKNDTPHSRAKAGASSTGFMGHAWDGGDIAHRVAMWAECLRVLKPGGHLLAFAGSRTYHRMTCAIEDAGFEIRDQIMWVYGSGFPKSRNLHGEHAGWGSAIKPAHEPICMARKPLDGTLLANVLAHGTGALNIYGCRIGEGLGRWPANVIHDGSPEVLEAFPDAPGQMAAAKADGSVSANAVYGTLRNVTHNPEPRADSGSAARFFYCAKASRTDRNEGLGGSDTPAVETAATMRDRETANWQNRNGNHHPTVKPTDLMAYLCRLVTPPGGLVLDPFMGSGSTGKAAMREGFQFVGIDMTPEYVEITRTRIEWELARVEAEHRFATAQQDLFAAA